MATALFMTYNSVGQPGEFPDVVEKNGHTAVLIQYPRESRLESSERRPMVEELFSKAKSINGEPDYVVIYIGAKGCEEAIRLGSRLFREKVGYIMCSCGLHAKAEVLQESYRDKPPHILICECGGQRSMGMMVEHFLQCGGVFW